MRLPRFPTTTSRPRAYLRIVLLDGQENIIDQKQILIPTGPNAWKSVSLELTANRAGYAVAYVANESQMDVLFDNIEVSLQRLIWQEDSYYPFGLGTRPIDVAGGPGHRFTYNGKELEEATGWLEYGQRDYDSQTGRFGKVDRFAEQYAWMTPYQYGANNPILHLDVNGDYSVHIHHRITYIALQKMGYEYHLSQNMASYASIYADNPESGVLFASRLSYGLTYSLVDATYWGADPYGLHSANWQRVRHSQRLEYLPGRDDYRFNDNIRHSMRSDSEAIHHELGISTGVSREDARLRGLKFGWDNVFEAAKAGGIDDIYRNQGAKEHFGIGIHALQDAYAHQGASWQEHSTSNDVFGTTSQAADITESAIVVIEILNGNFENYFDRRGRGMSLNLEGMGADQKLKVIGALIDESQR
jgi:RHS repeat-associated protein